MLEFLLSAEFARACAGVFLFAAGVLWFALRDERRDKLHYRRMWAKLVDDPAVLASVVRGFLSADNLTPEDDTRE